LIIKIIKLIKIIRHGRNRKGFQRPASGALLIRDVRMSVGARRGIADRQWPFLTIYSHRRCSLEGVRPEAAPGPIFGFFRQTSLHRLSPQREQGRLSLGAPKVSMHVAQFFNSLLGSADVEIIEALLPNRTRVDVAMVNQLCKSFLGGTPGSVTSESHSSENRK